MRSNIQPLGFTQDGALDLDLERESRTPSPVPALKSSDPEQSPVHVDAVVDAITARDKRDNDDSAAKNSSPSPTVTDDYSDIETASVVTPKNLPKATTKKPALTRELDTGNIIEGSPKGRRNQAVLNTPSPSPKRRRTLRGHSSKPIYDAHFHVSDPSPYEHIL